MAKNGINGCLNKNHNWNGRSLWAAPCVNWSFCRFFSIPMPKKVSVSYINSLYYSIKNKVFSLRLAKRMVEWATKRNRHVNENLQRNAIKSKAMLPTQSLLCCMSLVCDLLYFEAEVRYEITASTHALTHTCSSRAVHWCCKNVECNIVSAALVYFFPHCFVA